MTNITDITILLVEDNPGHASLVKKNLSRANISNEIVTIDNGLDAVNYLFDGQGDLTPEGSSPLLILLDLNLPGLDGLQVLSRIKSDSAARHIPVIILTTTDNPQEVEQAYELGCNVYITKPVAYEQLSKAIQQLGLFLQVVSLPRGAAAL